MTDIAHRLEKYRLDDALCAECLPSDDQDYYHLGFRDSSECNKYDLRSFLIDTHAPIGIKSSSETRDKDLANQPPVTPPRHPE